MIKKDLDEKKINKIVLKIKSKKIYRQKKNHKNYFCKK